MKKIEVGPIVENEVNDPKITGMWLSDGVFKVLRDIVIINPNKQMTISTLARAIKRSNTDIIFRRALFLANHHNIITFNEFGSAKVVNIDMSKLELFIRAKSQEFNAWGKFIERTNKLYSY